MPTAQSLRAASAACSAEAACRTTASPGSSTKPAFVPKEPPETGTLIAPGRWPAACSLERAHVEHGRFAGCGRARAGRAGRATHGPRLSATTRSVVGGLRRGDRRGDEHELLHVAEAERRVRLALAADRRRPVAAHVAAAERTRDVAGVDLDVRGSSASRDKRAVEVLGAFARGDREVGPGGVADEQRVAGEHDALVDDERAVLGPVARRVQHADRHRADRDDLAVRERLDRTRARRADASRPGRPCSSASAAVPGHVVGVRVGLEHALDADALLLGGGELLARSRTAGRRRPRRPPAGRRRDTRRSRGPRSRTAGRAARTETLTPAAAAGHGRRPDPAVDPGEERDRARARRRRLRSQGLPCRAIGRSCPWSLVAATSRPTR